MTVARISVNVRGSYNIKAVKMTDESITGVVRMSGSTKKTGRTRTVHGIATRSGIARRVVGICMAFLAPADDEEIHISPENLFFYGNERALGGLYRGPVPSSLDLRAYSDKLYSPKTSGQDRKSRDDIGFVSIPVTELGLAGSTLELIKGLAGIAQSTLPTAVEDMEEIQVRDDVNFKKSFGSMFGNFPLAIKQMALDQGRFFIGQWTTGRTDIETAFVPKKKIIPVPFNGLPQWAKDYMRKRRV